jgi:hypothetical protein
MHGSAILGMNCRLHNDQYTKNQPIKNCGLRASMRNLIKLWVSINNQESSQVQTNASFQGF